MKINNDKIKEDYKNMKYMIDKEKLKKEEIEDIISDLELCVKNYTILLKIEELITIPLLLVTYSIIFSIGFKNKIDMIILWGIAFIIDISIIAYTYYKTYQQLFYAEKMLEYYKKKVAKK